MERFRSCLDEKEALASVDQDVKLGQELGVRGTPTIFVNGEQITGYRPDQLLNLIKQLGRTPDSRAAR